MATRGPIPHTCPDIDKEQRLNKYALNDIKNLLKSWDEDDAKKQLDACFDRIDELSDFLEKMRTSNDQLRTWGAEMEDKAEDLEAQLQGLENELSSLSQHV